jgi:hypothetical protein
MNYIEQLHLDAINDTEYELIKHSAIYQIDKDKAAKKSAEITKKIAIEFAEWLLGNVIFNYSGKYRGYSNIELYQEFLKSKQPNDAIATS